MVTIPHPPDESLDKIPHHVDITQVGGNKRYLVQTKNIYGEGINRAFYTNSKAVAEQFKTKLESKLPHPLPTITSNSSELTTSQSELATKFIRPSPNEEHDEVHYQLGQHKIYQHLPNWVHDHLQSLTSPTSWHQAIKNGKIHNILPYEYPKMHNTTEAMVPINHKKRSRVAKLFASKSNITSPIVLHNKANNEKYCLAGHTRLAHNSLINKKPTPALHLEYHPVLEENATIWVDPAKDLGHGPWIRMWLLHPASAFRLRSYVTKIVPPELVESLDELHTTVFYCPTADAEHQNWPDVPSNVNVTIQPPYHWEYLGTNLAKMVLTLCFDSPQIHQEFDYLTFLGYSHSFPDLKPHITCAKCYSGDLDLLPVPEFPLIFNNGVLVPIKDD